MNQKGVELANGDWMSEQNNKDINEEIEEIAEKLPLMRRYRRTRNGNFVNGTRKKSHQHHVVDINGNDYGETRFGGDPPKMYIYEREKPQSPEKVNAFSSFRGTQENGKVAATRKKSSSEHQGMFVLPRFMRSSSFGSPKKEAKPKRKVSMMQRFFGPSRNYGPSVNSDLDLPFLHASRRAFSPNINQTRATLKNISDETVKQKVCTRLQRDNIFIKKEKKTCAIILLTLAIDSELPECFYEQVDNSQQFQKLIKTIVNSTLTEESLDILRNIND